MIHARELCMCSVVFASVIHSKNGGAMENGLVPVMETLVLHMRTCDGSVPLATRMRSLWKLRDDGNRFPQRLATCAPTDP
jgi:hypothetical protein